jgi:alanine racemase
MDHAMVDLTDVPQAREGDDAVLIGQQGDETISAHTFAGWGRTLAYEALTRLGPRVPRMHLTAGGQQTGLLQNR